MEKMTARDSSIDEGEVAFCSAKGGSRGGTAFPTEHWRKNGKLNVDSFPSLEGLGEKKKKLRPETACGETKKGT